MKAMQAQGEMTNKTMTQSNKPKQTCLFVTEAVVVLITGTDLMYEA